MFHLPLLIVLALPSSTQASDGADSLDASTTQTSSQPTSPATTAATTQSTTDIAPSPELLALIAQLNADDWHDRQKAEDQLVAEGQRVVPALRAAIATSDQEEIRQRAAEALSLIVENQTVGPSLITLHAKNMSPRDVFAELGRQAGATLEPVQADLFDTRPWPAVTIDADAAPFWNVLHDISDQCNIELRQWNEGIGLMPGQGRQRSGRPFISGPFLISLMSENRAQTVSLGEVDAQSTSDFNLTFNAMAEPKLRVLRSSYLAKIEEATDDRGNSLLVTDADPRGFRRGGMMADSMNPTAAGLWSFSARLSYPAQPGRQITVLRGSIGVQLQTRADRVEIADILSAANTVRTVGGLRLTVVSARKIDDHYDVVTSLSRDPAAKSPSSGMLQAGRVDWERVDQSIGDFKLLDDQDHPFRCISRQVINGNDQTRQWSMTFAQNPMRGGVARRAKAAEAAKLVWSVTTETREERVPFEFRDLPLPN